MRLIVMLAIYTTFLSACGVSKEMLPARSDQETPDFPLKDKPVQEAGVHVEKELLQITGVNDPLKRNTFKLAEGAEKFIRLEKKFRLPIHMDGFLILTKVMHSSQRCAGQVFAPKFLLMDDLFGVVELVPEQKVTIQHEKLYIVKVVFENPGLCTGVDVEFGVLFGH